MVERDARIPIRGSLHAKSSAQESQHKYRGRERQKYSSVINSLLTSAPARAPSAVAAMRSIEINRSRAES